MAKRATRKLARKIRRNPLARALATGRFRVRVVKRADTYKRRPKHPKVGDDEA